MSIKLDNNQMEAIKGSWGQLLIIACPGSGKTTTLLHRINHMIEKDRVNPANILMVTFTKSAAEEMKQRFVEQFAKAGTNRSSVTFRTIHGHCYWILRQITDKAPKMLDEKKQNDFFMSLIKYDKSIEDKREWIRNVKLEISGYKTSRRRQIDYVPVLFRNKGLLFSVYRKYEAFKESQGLRDFDDLLLDTYNLLLQNPKVLASLRNRFRFILVDEYQDVNTLHRDIIYLLAGENGNLSVVGDDDQAIYGFQGASPEIMLNFTKDYPDARVVRIATSYRSSEEIVESAARLISHNKKRFAKDFKPARGSKGRILIRFAKTREEQTSLIVSQIRQKVQEGTNLTDIAVLYRSNWQARSIARALAKQRIPYVCKDTLQDAYSHWIFKDMQCFCNIAKGCESSDDLKRVINRPNRYLREDGLFENGINLRYMKNVIAGSDLPGWQKENARDRIEEFCFFARVLQGSKNAGEVLKNVYEMGEYGRYLREFAEFSGAEPDDYEEIFAELAADAESCKSIDEWLAIKDVKEHVPLQTAGVSLSTMHSAKGLEWKAVYVIDCADKICPNGNSSDEEEERRLFYVAMTRAKNLLTLVVPGELHKKKVHPSPFLYECELLERPKKKPEKKTAKELREAAGQNAKMRSKYGVSKHDKFFNKYK